MTDDDCRIGPDHRYHPSRAKGRGKGRFGPDGIIYPTSYVSRWEQEVDFDLVALSESNAIRPEHLPKTNLLTDNTNNP